MKNGTKTSKLSVEVYQHPGSVLTKPEVQHLVQQFLSSRLLSFSGNQSFARDHFQATDLQGHVDHIDISGTSGGGPDSPVNYFIVQLDEQGCHTDGIEMDGEEIQAARQLILPAKELHGVWDSLIYGTGVKDKLLRYVFTAMRLSDRNVDPNLISWNRMVLLHGPPGTGKTSLCRALAQKLSVRLCDRYKYGYLVEVNSHSLFSKWFSESGKLVQKMFEHVQELIDDPCAFVCVLIDEVESLAAARKASSNEPSDAIRVVNAVLTQIDTIKQHSNVIIMTTSNITGTIDLAFVDRADIKQYIGPPSAEACYAMLSGSLRELMSKGLIVSDEIIYSLSSLNEIGDVKSQLSRKLWEEAQRCEGFSGRTLRKLPFLAMTEFECFPVSGDQFLVALHSAVVNQRSSNELGC